MLILLSLIVIIFVGIFLYKANKNTYNVSLKEVRPYTLDKNIFTNELHILQLSDIHLENLSITPEHLYSIVKKHPIDLIALTGDFLDRKYSIPKLIPYLQVLNQINPRYGIFAVFGNHDYLLKNKHFLTLKETLEMNGCIVLQNESVSLDINGSRVNIIGIDDFSTNRSDFKKSYHGIKDGYNLVLTHDPNAVLHMKNYYFDYLLSGHFHGGQILWPKPYHLAKMGKLPRKNIIKGLHFYDNKPFYISEGLGQTGINIRVGSVPEITIHHVEIPFQTKAQSDVI